MYRKPTKHVSTRFHSATPVRTARRSKGLSALLPVIMTALVFGFGFLYVAQSNSSATGALEIRQLERQIAKTKAETQELELTAASLRSLDTVQQATTKLGLVAKAPTETLPPLTAAVAVAR